MVETPMISPGSGTYTSAQTVSISTTTPNATIRYTADGSAPTETSSVYTGPLSVSTGTTIKAAAFKTGWTPSATASATYTMNFGTLAAPSVLPASGTYMMPVIHRFIARLLIALQVLLGVPTFASARPSRSPAATIQEPPVVRVNRTRPAVTSPPARPVFSTVPTDAEILRARVLPEPLVPIGASSPQENVALAAALNAYLDARDGERLRPIQRFMESHATSVWQPSLVLNAGLILLRDGYFTRAGTSFRAAWNLAKSETDGRGIGIADRAMGELLALESSLGHADVVEQLIQDVGGRLLTGAATERLSNAKQALFVMRTAPDEAFRCGPYALVQMLRAIRGSAAGDAKLLMTRAGSQGTSLARLADLGRAAGVDVTLIRQTSGVTFAVPGVVHFKAGHFAAILAYEHNRYLVRDATANGDRWIAPTALQEESSGAMLALTRAVPAGWEPMSSEDTANVWGRGFATGPPPNGPGPNGPRPPCPCASGNGMNRVVSQQSYGALRLEGTVSEPATVSAGGKPLQVSDTNGFSGSVPIGSGTTSFTVTAVDNNGNSASQGFEVDATGAETSFTFDDNGNMVSDASRTFEWDARNRLTAINAGSNRVEFTFDGMSRAVLRIEKTGGVITSQQRMVWCQSVVCEDRDESGSTVLRRSFPQGEERQGTLHFFVGDHLGSITSVNDGTSAVLAHSAYDPWGRRDWTSGADVTDVGLSGLRWEPVAGVWTTRFRSLDSGLGRWLSQDPSGRRDGPNLYAYVSNNPVRYVDPSGLVKWNCGYHLGSTGQLMTAVVFKATCTSECVNGWQLTQKLVGAGTGGSLSLPYTYSYSEATLEDQFGRPTEFTLPGQWLYVGAGWAFGVVGRSYSAISIGGAKSDLSWSYQVGLDAGVDVTSGFSFPVSSKWSPCKCK